LLDAGLAVVVSHVGPDVAPPAAGPWDIVLYHDISHGLTVDRVLDRVGVYLPDHPVVVISAAVGEEVVAELMRRRIADLVLSRSVAARLAPIVRREVMHARERGLLHMREQRSRAVLEALGSSRDWREAVEAALARMCAGFGAVMAVMWEMSDPESVLRPIASWSMSASNLEEVCLWASRLPARQTFAGRAILSGEPLVVQAPMGGPMDAKSSLLTSSFRDQGITGMICQPLQAGGRNFGVSLMFDDPTIDLDDANVQLVSLAAVLQPALLRRLVEHERNLLRGALDATRSGVMITDTCLELPGPHIIYANQAVAAMTGYTLHELLGGTPRMLQGADTSRPVLSALREALEQAEPFNAELLNYRKDGSSFLVDLDITPVREDGRVAQFIAVQTDVTARRAAEEELYAAVRLGPGVLYRAQLVSSHVRLISVHGDSQRVEALLGDAAGDSASLATLLHEHDNIALLRSIVADANILEGTVDLRVQWADGSVRWVRNTVRVSSRAEKTLEFIGYFLDVTDHKDAELRRQQTTALSSLGEMATAMAHELNQPLSSISFAAQNVAAHLRRDQPDLRVVAGKVEKIVSEALRASKLIDHMKLFARNERQKVAAVSWSHVACKALEILASRLDGVSVRIDLPRDLPQVLGATIAMEQILINLLANAIDAYNDAGTHSRAERLLMVDARLDGHAVVLRVADQAGGIADEVLPHIFEPFFTTKEPGKGTGLGLALCSRSAANMGGTLSARNEDGGAVFEISLPRASISMPETLVAE
jgi:PAS domain S-box-containing protein